MQEQLHKCEASCAQLKRKRPTSNHDSAHDPAHRKRQGIHTNADPGTQDYNMAIKQLADELILDWKQSCHGKSRQQLQQIATAHVMALRELPEGDELLVHLAHEAGVALARKRWACNTSAGSTHGHSLSAV